MVNLKGKTTRAKFDAVKTGVDVITPLPPQILEFYGTVTLVMDVMKVNSLPFLVLYGRVVKFGTTTKLINTKVPLIVAAITLILRVYGTRGFKVSFIAADNEFAPLSQDETFLSLQVVMNLTSEDEPEPFADRFIRTIK